MNTLKSGVSVLIEGAERDASEMCIRDRYQRMGYAKEAVKGILEYEAEELEAQRVILRIHTENQPSRHVAEQMGFHLSTQRLEKEPDVRLYVYDL